MSNQDRKDTQFVRFIAILLITNSHLDHLYPIPQLGTGGAIGNALFFMLSGYGLATSWQKNKYSFFKWYERRILRIYPSLIIVVAVFNLWLEGAWRYWTVKDYITSFIYPTTVWFISALMIFYILIYVVLRSKNHWIFLAGIISLFVPYFYFYFTSVDLSQYTIEGPSYFKWIFYFQMMLFGGYLAHYSEIVRYKGPSYLVYLASALLLYLLLGAGFIKGHYTQYQFIIHLLTFAIVYFTFAIARSQFILEKIMGNNNTSFLIAFISGLTLEIYLMQYNIYSSKIVTSLIFPLNIISFWIIVILLSFFVSKISGFIRPRFASI
jgi:peptidoglycan/LPS O-acetylase OafA/YrhL